MVHLGALVAVAAHAWAFFSGRYLPYIDWSNHVGLISILAHGSDSGALVYAERSFAPTPYFLFYMVSALIGQVVLVPIAAKVSLLLSSALMTYGAAYLAERSGRSGRLGLIAPLALFGFSLGYGFGAFVFSLPLLVFALAAGEGLVEAVDDDAAPGTVRRRSLLFAFTLVLVYLGHGLLFLMTALLISVRFLGAVMARGIFRERGRAGRLAAAFALAFVPVALLAVPLFLTYVGSPWAEGGAAVTGRFAQFDDAPLTWAQVGSHLLERGSAAHWLTMKLSAVLLGVWLVLSVLYPHPRRPARFGLEIYALALCLFYLFGPVSLERPFQIWMVYPRFATLAALLLFLLPRCDLRGWRVAFAMPALALVIYNADVNRRSIVTFSNWAKQYDPVRKTVPPGARVLALTERRADDLTNNHHALGSLFFYHLADGAVYTAFLFDNPLHPVRLKKEGRPRAPPWNRTYAFDPKVHGVDFDYLVLRGPRFVDRTRRAGLHDFVAELNGWSIFRTRVGASRGAFDLTGPVK